MAYVLFLLAGLGFGYGAVGGWKLFPLVFPILLAIAAFLRDGVSAGSVVKLVIAIVLTLIGIAVGAILDERGARSQEARTG
jgi:hypothetical protein